MKCTRIQLLFINCWLIIDFKLLYITFVLHNQLINTLRIQYSAYNRFVHTFLTSFTMHVDIGYINRILIE